MTRRWDEDAIATGRRAATRRTTSGAPLMTGEARVAYRSTIPSTIASWIDDASRCSSRSRLRIVAAHSLEFEPMTACWSSCVHGRSCARANSTRTSSHHGSLSVSTPSRSNSTASKRGARSSIQPPAAAAVAAGYREASASGGRGAPVCEPDDSEHERLDQRPCDERDERRHVEHRARGTTDRVEREHATERLDERIRHGDDEGHDVVALVRAEEQQNEAQHDERLEHAEHEPHETSDRVDGRGRGHDRVGDLAHHGPLDHMLVDGLNAIPR